MREFFVEEKLQKLLIKLNKKDKETYEAIINKIQEIVESTDVNHYKNLRSPMQKFKRVHIRNSFVLIFTYDQRKDSIQFYDFDHHDNIYN